jgi:RimJ/RimL family protein N-acetyltransferase
MKTRYSTQTFDLTAGPQPVVNSTANEASPPRPWRWSLPGDIEVLETAAGITFQCDGSKYFVRELESDGCATVSKWLENPSVNAWLDFGNGRQQLDALSIRVMASSPDHFVRVVLDSDGRALGVFGLQQVRNPFRVAQFWGVRPVLRPPARLRVAVAMRIVLALALRTHDLSAVQAWAVEGNLRSIRILEELGFRAGGRQRRCHLLGGEMRDRVLFDLLPEEFESHEEVTRAEAIKSLLSSPAHAAQVHEEPACV